MVHFAKYMSEQEIQADKAHAGQGRRTRHRMHEGTFRIALLVLEAIKEMNENDW